MNKSNYFLVKDLEECYTPVERGIVSTREVGLIKEKLQLTNATRIELQNMRDFVVMYYGNVKQHKENENNYFDPIALDKMSAITYVVDNIMLSLDRYD